VLLDDRAARSLLGGLGVDAAPFAAAAERAGADLRISVAPLWSRKRRYRFLVAEAYRRLAAAVDSYLHGISHGAGTETDMGPVYYHLVREMAALINQRIEVVNRQCSPSELLQYVKQFDPVQIERECITGGGSPGNRLDAGLCFKPLDFDALALPVFPLLAPPDQARDALVAAADAVYRTRPAAADRLLDEIKRAAVTPRAGPDR
jgi:hypothetical protein